MSGVFVLQVKPPWLKILRSGAVWAIIVAHVSFTWVYSWILAYLPMYMEEVLRYDIAQVNIFTLLVFRSGVRTPRT